MGHLVPTSRTQADSRDERYRREAGLTTHKGSCQSTQRGRRKRTLMATRKFSDLVSHIDNDPERSARVDVLEQKAWDALAAHNLRELRRAREMT